MNNIQSSYNDEIDIFDLLNRLYKGKWVISLFVLISILSGLSYYFIKDHVYQSKLYYEITNPPPFVQSKIIHNDLNNYFFSEKMFNKWKNIYTKKTSINYEEFLNTEILNGFVFQKRKDQLFIEFIQIDGLHAISIKSKNLSMINDFFNYLNYINRNLMTKYISKVEEELTITKNFIRGFSSNDFSNQSQINSLQKLMDLNSYLNNAKEEYTVLTIKRPTVPIRTSPPRLSILMSVSLVLGLIIGSFYVLILQSFRQHKDEENKI